MGWVGDAGSAGWDWIVREGAGAGGDVGTVGAGGREEEEEGGEDAEGVHCCLVCLFEGSGGRCERFIYWSLDELELELELGT